MIPLLLMTLASQVLLHRSFDPLVEYLPMSLATQSMADRYAKHKKSSGSTGSEIKDEIVDLFNPERMKSVLRRRLLKQKPRRHTYDKDEIREHEKVHGKSHHPKEEEHEHQEHENRFDPSSPLNPVNQTNGHHGEPSGSGVQIERQTSRGSHASKASSKKIREGGEGQEGEWAGHRTSRSSAQETV
jgi:Mg-chelatase subunit ChlI